MDGRRTRSTRSKVAQDIQELPATTRSTRRTKKQTNDEEEATETINEEVESSEIESGADCENQSEQAHAVEDNGSSNDDNFEQQLNEKEEETNQTDETVEKEQQEEFIADLAEENANSFPSACDDSSNVGQEHETNNQTENNASVQDSLDAEFQQSMETDTFAISEDVKQKDDQATDLDAENISEDELPPQPSKPEVQDAEEVSDEELPGPKMAELPADTEIVSEEELPPTTKKEGKRKLEDYDPSDPTETEETDAPEKKAKREGEEPEKKYRLPDLEKYWKAVKADSEDFNAWTYLLQYVDSENDVEAAREAYDKFLSRYCYCYGYWRKYADYEKKKGSMEKCEEVFERGLKAIPLSIDLWIHYLTHVKQNHQEDRDYIRSQFERALSACGLEFRSDKLWEGYIRWENEEKNLLNIVAIYDRLLATPTQAYKSQWENFRELVNNSPVQKLIPVEEFKKLREEVRKDSNEKIDLDEIPPGEDEADDHVSNEEEADAIRKMIISKRKKLNKANVEMINKRWTFEENIKRPYFHVKQLEKIQLKNWKEYLDFEIEQGDKKRILVLFERCLIACALYDEFWIKLIRYLESDSEDPEFEARTRDVYERACTIHHPDKVNLHLMWAAFEETINNADKASKILENIDKNHPNLLQVAYRRINLERRRGNLDACVNLYEQYYENAKNKNIASALAIKYARFIYKIKHDYEKAQEILKSSLEKDPTNTRLALQYIDLSLQRQEIDEKEIVGILDKYIQQDNLDTEQKLLFAQRKVEFLEDFGSSVRELQEAQKVLQSALEKSKENKKKATSEHESAPASKKFKESSSSNNGAAYSSAYNYQGYSNPTYANQWAGGYNYDYNQWSGSYYNQSSYGQHGSYGSSY